MTNSRSESYEAAGVDITAGYKSVELMKSHIARAATKGAFGIGGFGGMFQPDLAGLEQPVFVSGTDGVGTKLRIAILTDTHDTIGVDAVAMCVNDIICCGAKPLFFLDYIACGRNVPEKIERIVSGVADGCVAAGCALVGGETAEHPGMMPEEDYDIAGFAVGVVDRRDIILPERVKKGDKVIGIASSGFHSNGFSLIRKVFDVEHADLNEHILELGESLGAALLRPTRIYVKPILALLKSGVPVNGISNITGGGFYENIPRCLPDGLSAKIEKAKVNVPSVIKLLWRRGAISEHDMFNTFNMGVGMVVVTGGDDAADAVRLLSENGEQAAVIGEIVESKEGVILW